MQRFIKYFSMLVFFIAICYLGSKILLQYKQMANVDYNIVPLYLAEAIFSYVLGIVLGLPYLVQEMRKQGTWKYDWNKALAIVIPALFISLMPLMAMANLFSLTNLLMSFPTQLFGIVGFYFLTTSFCKSQVITENLVRGK